ncbi:MAG: ATP synthase F0 subunit B [Epulopiscium sp. Nuni2H_MBin001]|nr:MAG: ATP synthase F0 subunit B [Epulopiscium sp. Nuni2H_MBin001]
MVTVWEWFWQVLALVIIVLILKKLLFKPVSDFLEKRRQLIANDVQSAANSRKQAQALEMDYNNKIAHINQEADMILKDARAKALARESQIIDEAKQEALAIKEKAQEDIRLEQEKVKAEIKAEMIEVAALMASKFVQSSMDKSKQDVLIAEIIDEMGDVSWLQ